MSKKEVELSAKLDLKQFNSLRKYLQTDFKAGVSLKRFMIRFSKDKVDVRDPVDIRYKCTNGHHELVVKKGALGSQSRQESIIQLGKNNQSEYFVAMFILLGYKTGNAMYRELEKFTNSKVEVTLAKAFHLYFVEVESIAANSRTQALKDVLEFFDAAGIKPLSRADYQSFQRLTDREANFHFALKDFPQPLLDSDKWKKVCKATIFAN